MAVGLMRARYFAPALLAIFVAALFLRGAELTSHLKHMTVG